MGLHVLKQGYASTDILSQAASSAGVTLKFGGNMCQRRGSIFNLRELTRWRCISNTWVSGAPRE